ncbi:MAG: protein-methionine-sulfoxide reductase catalytic subunit MsrP [Pseudomonadales bacterium]|nr:protein-methionine-sulfoxide reductase catalytic subunit MsrP [Pseudomonadales bacterium]MCP5185209.1 protein-methionine-sulfoxide reductase catalytic subunit MsrP [Pseudomonadales bacterium]
MRYRRNSTPTGSEITPESIVLNRRRVVGVLGLGLGMATMPAGTVLAGLQADDTPTPEAIVTGYNNFYEFGTGKFDPAEYAHEMTVRPWTVEVSGEAARTGTFALDDLLKGLAVEERIYRFRCVEAWSMVVPWQGVALKAVLEQFRPNGNAKFVAFTTLERPKEMRGQRALFSGIDWPYVEGLRMDEAYHPLAFMATGLYGKPLPNQNGAPWRLVVPWKYGFKSAKSIVRIHFTNRQPRNTWNTLQASEYGFYANVNPSVDHPRWSQATERRLPSTLLNPNRRPTLPFNGYAEEVASLYDGMDLRRYF